MSDSPLLLRSACALLPRPDVGTPWYFRASISLDDPNLWYLHNNEAEFLHALNETVHFANDHWTSAQEPTEHVITWVSREWSGIVGGLNSPNVFFRLSWEYFSSLW